MIGGMDATSHVATRIVEQARSLGPHDRADFVRRACGSDETLLSEVLVALSGETSWADLEAGEPHEHAQPRELEGQRLGPYRILRKLGSGGMGDVWLAERADDEYQQHVAIKIVRSGLYSTQVQSRLRTERQILATLQHPNIARLLDGGRDADGTPYLVMEYIDGEAVDVYCNRRRLSLAERIELARKICSAVHYAHQNLIVHRDLKPNNILITPDGVPKLLDFGIAKLLDTRHSAYTLAVTHFEYRVMTPAHASPEQVRGDAVTTASDIYVLGVLLYELLGGRRPFQLVGSSFSEIERVICEQEPVSPSAMLRRTMADSPELAADIATCRSTTPSRLLKQLEGDLDGIILMAMRKEAERRYSSAEQLSADLGRYLTGQPVLATRDTWLYRTRKFVSRHALAVAASLAAIVTLAAFATVTFVQAQRIAAERDIADSERMRAEQVSSFLVELFELSDPSKSRGNQVTARELLDIGARRVSIGLTDQPETRATLLGTIGTVYNSLGLYTDAIPVLQEALDSRRKIYGAKHLKVAQALTELGDALCEHGELDACERRLKEAQAMQRELAGPDSLELAPTLAAMGRLAQRRDALAEAEGYFNESFAIYRGHGKERTAEASSIINELASLEAYRGDYERAAQLYTTALDIDRQALGNDHPQVGIHIHDLAVVRQMQGKLSEAEPLYEESTQLLTRVLGKAHPSTLDAMGNYGRFLHRKGDLIRAQDVLSGVLEADRAARGPRHPYVGHDLVNLAMVQLDSGQAPEAERNALAALDIYRSSLPAEHAYIASALSVLGRALAEQGRTREAQQPLHDAITMGQKTLPADSPQLAAARSALARLNSASR
jgi:serine/threonine-protein kinase